MTRTSATRASAQSDEVAELLGIISRRASHEVRNALNGVAVNIEVVRSRLSRPAPDLVELKTFADRASQESDGAAALTNGLADLARLLARAAAASGKAQLKKSDGQKELAVPLHSSDDAELSADIRALAARMGVAIKLDGPTVIFTVRD